MTPLAPECGPADLPWTSGSSGCGVLHVLPWSWDTTSQRPSAPPSSWDWVETAPVTGSTAMNARPGPAAGVLATPTFSGAVAARTSWLAPNISVGCDQLKPWSCEVKLCSHDGDPIAAAPAYTVPSGPMPPTGSPHVGVVRRSVWKPTPWPATIASASGRCCVPVQCWPPSKVVATPQYP